MFTASLKWYEDDTQVTVLDDILNSIGMVSNPVPTQYVKFWQSISREELLKELDAVLQKKDKGLIIAIALHMAPLTQQQTGESATEKIGP